MLYTVKEVAAELRISHEGVRRMVRQGRMDSALVSRVGTHYRFGKLDPRKREKK